MDIMKVLTEINDLGTTVIVATHDREIVNELKKRVILLEAGRIAKDYEKGTYDNEVN
jgi:cell division transport system ATP-binding protein